MAMCAFQNARKECEVIMREKNLFTKSTTFDLGYLFDKPTKASSRNHNNLNKNSRDIFNKELSE